MKKEQRFNIGDKVFAKVKGYPAWPAIVLEENGKKYKVKFYGTGEIGQIKHEDLFYYSKNKQRLLKPSKRKDFNDSVSEIEEAIRIAGTDGSPDYDSEKADSSVLNDSNSTIDTESSVAGPTKKRKRSASVGNSVDDKLSVKLKKGKISIPSKSDSSSSLDEKKNNVTLEKENGDEDSVQEKELITDNAEIEVEMGQNPTVSEATSAEETKIELQNEFGLKDCLMEKELEGFIAYGDHVEKHKEIYIEMPTETREDSQSQILPFFDEANCIGIKFHKDWPLKTFKNEFERAIYDKKLSQQVLNLKASFKQEDLKKNQLYFENLKINKEDMDKYFQEKLLSVEKNILNKLKIESTLLELDSKIKNCLGLDKAEPKEAIILLKEILNLNLTTLMLKKHAHVVEMVRRLRKYIGNVDDWNLNNEEKKAFEKEAEEVRNLALKVYVKFMQIVGVKTSGSGENFLDSFNVIATKFRQETKDLSEMEYYNLTCEPYSRMNFLNNYFIKHMLLSVPDKSDQAINSESKNDISRNETVK